MSNNRIYNMPDNYIHRHRTTAFLTKYQSGNQVLACWYIGPDTGRLMGVYFHKDGPLYAYIRAFKIKKNNTYVKDEFFEISIQSVIEAFRRSPEVYCTDYMPYFIGISNNLPAKTGVKIIPFPAFKKGA